jgi:hypothetical protein
MADQDLVVDPKYRDAQLKKGIAHRKKRLAAHYTMGKAIRGEVRHPAKRGTKKASKPKAATLKTKCKCAKFNAKRVKSKSKPKSMPVPKAKAKVMKKPSSKSRKLEAVRSYGGTYEYPGPQQVTE